jgi:multidrug efflux pump subunit AcrA (membrane-fusion protein)
MKRGGKKAFIIIAIIILAGAGGYALWASAEGKKKAAQAGELERVKVEKRLVDDSIEVSGHLKPQAEQEIRAPADGIVEEVFAKEGAVVAKGDAIAALDTTAARYELKKLEYDIDQESFAGNRRKVELLEGERAVKQRALEDLTIRAHLDGLVSRLDLKQGDVLKVSTNYGRVIDVRRLVADVEIAEVDIPRARPGLPVEFRFPALPGLNAEGRLASFAAEARINDQKLTVLDAKLVIDRPPEGLLAAYSFNATIKAGEPRPILVVDSRAIGYEGGKPRVMRLKKGAPADSNETETVEISTEGFGAGLVRVVSGLSEGDELLVKPVREQMR